ncbi:MAG: glycosyltransferase family 9 protein [Nitrospiraceae bacterium]|nr:glycosyltransferase family 9 protein [Nitrospiraceae bacterium]
MNIDLARKVDYYAGVPLCFLGTLLRKGIALFFPRRAAPPPSRVLLIELSEMGSTILADPAMQKLKRAGGAELFFAIFRRNRPSLDLLGTVPPGNIFELRDSGLLVLAADSLRLLVWVRRKRIDTVIDLELFSRFSALLTGFSGAARRAGFHAFHAEGLYRGDFLTHKVLYNPHQHIAKNFIALVNAVLSDHEEVPYSKTMVGDGELRLGKAVVTGAARSAMQKKIAEACPVYDARRHRIVVFNTNASDLMPLRRWPEAHYRELARMVLDRHADVVLLLTGAEAERSGKTRLANSIASERCVNFAGLTTVAELPALYALSSLMVTNDSGPAHFATATDIRLFVLFGPESPAVYGPLGRATTFFAGLSCSPCVSASNHRKSPCTDNRCLKLITPDQVYEAIRPVLSLRA